MTRPVIFLGIDGLDAQFVREHLDDLPTFRRLSEIGTLTGLESIFPPDSIPAWITIFTGEPPEVHGVLESIDYLGKNPAQAIEQAPAFLHGRTFWDVVSRGGRRVCVINPFMAYPSWRVNGAMVSGPVFVEAAEPSVQPPDGADGLSLPQLGGIVDFPTANNIEAFLERALLVTHEQTDFGLAMFDRVQPDLFFMNILTVDRIQHFLWRYFDPGDPTYPGHSSLERGVLDAYVAADVAISRFLDVTGDGVVVVASDHGHGRRPTRMVYIDELLRRHGLFSTGSTRRTVKTYALEKAKRAALTSAYVLRREHQAYALAKRIPGRRALKTSKYARGEESLATASRMFGRNSVGGVEVDSVVTGAKRESVINRVCDLLRETVDSDGTPLFVWVRRREEMFPMNRSVGFPDVLFQLREDLGVDYGVFGPIVARDTMHRRISGGHRHEGVFASSSRNLPSVPASIKDLHALVVEMSLG